MRDAVQVRILRDCVTAYGPKTTGDVLAMGRRRAAPLIEAGAAEAVEAPAAAPPKPAAKGKGR